MTRTSVVLLLVCSGVAVRLHSQAPARPVVASISGNVVDGVTGKPIAGAGITMTPAHRSPGPCGVSNFGDGQFLCEVYEPGDFELNASYRGYALAEFDRTQVAPDKNDRSTGVYSLYPDYDWGALAAWAWDSAA